LAHGPLEELDQWARELLRDSPVAHLGLLDSDDDPRVLPITFAIAGGRIWSAIDSKPKRAGGEPARLGFLRRRPEVALTVDRYQDDWSRLAWVQVLGRASLHPVDAEPDALAALTDKYEQYATDPPPGPMIGIEPRRALTWRAAGAYDLTRSRKGLPDGE
jgi:PPOX class probable F420-dependent enzyme